MSVPLSAALAPPGADDAIQPAGRMCPGTTARIGAGAAPSVTSLFPPRDADVDARRAWLASSPWPEIVFASAQ